MNDIEHVKEEKSKTELSKIQRLFLTIIILFECVALCFIIAAIAYIFLPEKELPVSSQEFYTERYRKEGSEQWSKNQEEQIKKQLHQEQIQIYDTAKQETGEDKQSEIVQEQQSQQQTEIWEYNQMENHQQQQSEGKESQTLDTDEPDLPDLSLQTELVDQGARVAGAVYPKSDIDPDKPMIALTFDDGPYEAVTNRILDILEQHDARATFFVLGLQVKTHAETLQRIHSLGCQIGNHSYSHKSLHSLSIEDIHKEIDDTNSLIREIIDIEVNIVRPPYGSPNDYLKEAIPYPLVMWSVDPKDWKSLNKEAIVSEVVDKVKDGDIVIMHDTYPSTADACEVIIPRLIEDGYQLVTVDEMMECRNITMASGKAYYNARRK